MKIYRNQFTLLVLIIVVMAVLIVGCKQKVNRTHWREHGYVEGRFTLLASPIGGKLVVLPVKRGDTLKEGELAFELDSEAPAADLAAAEADVKQATFDFADLRKGKRPSEIKSLLARQHEIEAKQVFARKEVSRYRTLLKQKHIEERELDVAVKNLRELDAQLAKIKADLVTAKLPARQDTIHAAYERLQAAKARLTRARWMLEQTHITAPKAGYVYDTFYRIGEQVPVNQPVVSLMLPEDIKAVFFIGASDLSKLHIGDTVKIYCVNCKQPILAEIEFISPRAEYTPPVIYSEGSREKLVYRIEARFKQPLDKSSSLHPGEPIDITLNNHG